MERTPAKDAEEGKKEGPFVSWGRKNLEGHGRSQATAGQQVGSRCSRRLRWQCREYLGAEACGSGALSSAGRSALAEYSCVVSAASRLGDGPLASLADLSRLTADGCQSQNLNPGFLCLCFYRIYCFSSACPQGGQWQQTGQHWFHLK